MALDDRAIVVGINRYPALGDLSGPANDATAFEAWLKDPKGGDVPAGNIVTILSPPKAKANPIDAQPNTAIVEAAFDVLYERGDHSNGKAGRRLYIYMAGHGFAADLEEAALLMANAARGRTGHHIPGRPYANWFRRSAFFDEVVLFMDCCRDNLPRAPLRAPPYEVLTSANEARRFYGFATKWSHTAREKKQNGKVRGVFTTTLLAGLYGAAPNENGRVTGASIQKYVFNSLPALLGPGEFQEPVFDFDSNNDLDFGQAGTQFQLHVKLSAAHAGKAITLVDGKLTPIAPIKTTANTADWDLAFGLYQVEVAGGPKRVVELVGVPRKVSIGLG